MTKKSKRGGNAGTPIKAGNACSADSPEAARPWTDEEMAAAKPLPLPTVDPVTKVGTPGVPYAGEGETKPAGRPEEDKRTAR
jgi:hypothetical protein